MCVMTEPFSSQTDFTCWWLCSSHNLSANNKNIPIIWNDDITPAVGPEPTSALRQNRQLLLIENYRVLRPEEPCWLLTCHRISPLQPEQTWLTPNAAGSRGAWRTKRDKLFRGAELSRSAAK